MSPDQTLDDAAVREVLTHGSVDIDGRVLPASNVTLVGEVELAGVSLRCVYKPISGERPLWDFPSRTLAAREVAAYEVSELAGWHLVPVTVIGEGPFGAGMLQQWVDVGDNLLVDVVPAGAVPDGWRHVLDAYDGTDQPVSLVHADVQAIRDMALFDAVVNNADRKAGHVLITPTEEIRGCDHGLTFHTEDKLRTVLWGWAGEPLAEADLAGLRQLLAALDQPARAEALRGLLSGAELALLRRRVQRLVARCHFPLPPDGWRAVPWPVF